MKKVPLLLASLLLASPLARAQVELVYQTPTEALVIEGLNNKMPVYEKDGRLVPIPEEGDFAIRSGGAYADLSAESFVRYRVRIELGNFMKPGGLTVSYALSLADPGREIKSLDVYYVCLWQIPGKIAQVVIKPLRATDRGLYDDSGDFLIGKGEEKGFMRVYFFADGKLIRGIPGKKIKSENDFPALRLAIDGGDREAVQAWAKAHPAAVLSKSLMQSLVQWGDAAALAAVLSRDPAVNKLKGDDGLYMLIVAILAGRNEAVGLLLKEGVKANRRLGDLHPVQAAVENGSLDILQQLVRAGADVNAKAYAFGIETTALKLALQTGDVGLVEYLVAQGAKWPASKEELSQCAMRALSDGWSDMFERLIRQGVDPDYKDAGTPLLLHAILAHRDEMARTLLAHGAKVDATDTLQATALMAAAAMGKPALVDDLLKAGASLRAKNKMGNTAAVYAIRGGNPDLARSLVARYQPDEADWAHLLASALMFGDESLVTWAAAHTTRIAYQPNETETLMDGAIRFNQPDIVRTLTENEVNGNGVTRGEWNFAGVAERYERGEILAIFQKQLGDKLAVKRPVISELPAKQFDLVPVPVPPEVLEQGIHGEARVEIYIDPEGRPAFPLLRSSNNPRIDPYAIQSVMQSSFNRVSGRAWRRVVVPVDFYRDGTDGSGAVVYRASSIEVAPVLTKPHSGNFEFLKDKSTAVRVALVDFVIERTGTVASPTVVAGNDAATDGGVVAAFKQLAFSPGKKGGKPVACTARGAWLLPHARYMPSDALLPVEELGAGDRLPTLLKKGSIVNRSGAKPTGPQATILTYTVTTAGRAEGIRVVAATNKEAADRAVERCDTSQYASARKAGAPVTMSVVQCLTEDAWEDQFYIN